MLRQNKLLKLFPNALSAMEVEMCGHTDHEYSSANTAHKKCEKALAKLKEAIKDLI